MIVRGAPVAPVGAGIVRRMPLSRARLVGPLRLLGAAVVALAVILVGATPSGAHGDAGTIEIDVPEDRGALTVGLRIRLTYDGDEHPVEEADAGGITVEATGPDGATTSPEGAFVATEVPGVYAADLTFPAPGTWEVTVSADEPAASATTTVEVTEDAVTAAGDDGGSDDEGGEEVTVDTIEDGGGTARIVERGSGGDGPTPLLVTLLVAGVLVVAGIVGGVMLRRRGRST